MMKKDYEKVEIEVIEFEVDVILTSNDTPIVIDPED